MTQTAEELAYLYNEVAIYEEEIKTINQLCAKLASDDHEVMIGFNILKEPENNTVEEPKTAFVQSTMGMIAVQVNKAPNPEEPSPYMWVVNEVTAIRLLGIIHESLNFEIKKLKSEIHETNRNDSAV